MRPRAWGRRTSNDEQGTWWNVDYDAGYGSQEVRDGGWLERGEYDGSE